MKRTLLLPFIICIIYLSSSTDTALADNNGQTLDGLVTAFKKYSPDIAQICSYYEQKSLEYSYSQEQFNSVSAMLTDYQRAQQSLSLSLSRVYFDYKDSIIQQKIKLAETGFISDCHSSVRLSTACSDALPRTAEYYAA